MPKLSCLKSFAFSLALILSSCATPPNKPICVELAPDRGRCVKVISGEEFEINETNKFEGKTWWELRPALILMPASTWAAFKAFIIKICNKSSQCERAVGTWERSLDYIDAQFEEKGIPLP